MIEYAVLIMIILGSLFVFKAQILRAFHGRWKATGDNFGMGRQYDPKKTNECIYAQINSDYGLWYDNICYYQTVRSPVDQGGLACAPGNFTCENDARIKCCQDFCCEYDDEQAGHSNCEGAGGAKTCKR